MDNKECILPRIYLPDVLTHGISRPTSDGLSKDFIESFLCKDGKPIALSDLYQGDASISLEMQTVILGCIICLIAVIIHPI